MSSRQLTQIKTHLLAKYLNVSIISKALPNKDIITSLKDSVNDLEIEETEIPSLLRKTFPRTKAKL